MYTVRVNGTEVAAEHPRLENVVNYGKRPTNLDADLRRGMRFRTEFLGDNIARARELLTSKPAGQDFIGGTYAQPMISTIGRLVDGTYYNDSNTVPLYRIHSTTVNPYGDQNNYVCNVYYKPDETIRLSSQQDSVFAPVINGEQKQDDAIADRARITYEFNFDEHTIEISVEHPIYEKMLLDGSRYEKAKEYVQKQSIAIIKDLENSNLLTEPLQKLLNDIKRRLSPNHTWHDIAGMHLILGGLKEKSLLNDQDQPLNGVILHARTQLAINDLRVTAERTIINPLTSDSLRKNIDDIIDTLHHRLSQGENLEKVIEDAQDLTQLITDDFSSILELPTEQYALIRPLYINVVQQTVTDVSEHIEKLRPGGANETRKNYKPVPLAVARVYNDHLKFVYNQDLKKGQLLLIYQQAKTAHEILLMTHACRWDPPNNLQELSHHIERVTVLKHLYTSRNYTRFHAFNNVPLDAFIKASILDSEQSDTKNIEHLMVRIDKLESKIEAIIQSHDKIGIRATKENNQDDLKSSFRTLKLYFLENINNREVIIHIAKTIDYLNITLAKVHETVVHDLTHQNQPEKVIDTAESMQFTHGNMKLSDASFEKINNELMNATGHFNQYRPAKGMLGFVNFIMEFIRGILHLEIKDTRKQERITNLAGIISQSMHTIFSHRSTDHLPKNNNGKTAVVANESGDCDVVSVGPTSQKGLTQS